MKKQNMKKVQSNIEIETIDDDIFAAQIRALEGQYASEEDLSLIPEVKNWESARRGVFYRPIKRALSLRLDTDLIAWFKRDGIGYQTRINDALREYVKQKQGNI